MQGRKAHHEASNCSVDAEAIDVLKHYQNFAEVEIIIQKGALNETMQAEYEERQKAGMKDEINEKNACEGTYQEEMAKDAESNGPPEDKIADIELNQESDK